MADDRVVIAAILALLATVLFWAFSGPSADVIVRPDTKASKSVFQLSLNGANWKLHNENGSIDIDDVTVPGNMYTAMMKEELIDDPYYRFNDVTYRWVHWDNWTYTTVFNVDYEILSNKAVRLVCDGLDTIATVYLNDIRVGSANNQFVRYVFDIKEMIKPGGNQLKVAFTSAPHYARDQYNRHTYHIPPACPPPEYHPECHANFIRKAQCSFSWDWGPAFATQGIWKGIQVEVFDEIQIRDAVVTSHRDENSDWQLNITTYYDPAIEKFSGTLKVFLLGMELAFPVELHIDSHMTSHMIHIPRDMVVPWMPRGYGEPRLYNLDLILHDASMATVAQKSLKTGFRTVELVQDPMDNGLTFYFKVNGVPIYMKGSNWIPADMLLDRVTPQRLRELLQSAADSNMNSLRIWGGGIYEADEFYDLADELGLLVWQDMMFACSMYPTHAAFLQTVAEEIHHQTRRLAHHPCIVAWTANNENEGCIVDDWFGTRGALYQRYKEDYVTLYIDTVRASLLQNYDVIPFLSSSPTNGLVSQEHDWISEELPASHPNYGDVHYYNYKDDCLDLSIYPRTRYASEYGYQSWPSLHTISKVSEQADWAYGSDFFKHRQHHSEAGGGTDQIVKRHFVWPDSGDSLQDFKSYIFLTQVAQSLCYRAQTEFYRRGRSDPEVFNMGALYWQHNDIWQAPSWATIDYYGNWKMAHYYAMNFFNDQIVSAYEEQGVLNVYAVFDQPETSLEVDVVLELWSWDSNPSSPLHTFTIAENVSTIGSSKLYEAGTDQLLRSGGCSIRDRCFFLVYLNQRNTSKRLTPEAPVYLAAFKQHLHKANITVEVMPPSARNTYELQLTTDHVTAFVWMEADDVRGRFSDNGFVMTSQRKSVTFFAWQDTTEQVLRDALSVISLNGLYSMH